MNIKRYLAERLRAWANELYEQPPAFILDYSRISEGCMIVNGVEYWRLTAGEMIKRKLHISSANERHAPSNVAKIGKSKPTTFPPRHGPKDAA